VIFNTEGTSLKGHLAHDLFSSGKWSHLQGLLRFPSHRIGHSRTDKGIPTRTDLMGIRYGMEKENVDVRPYAGACLLKWLAQARQEMGAPAPFISKAPVQDANSRGAYSPLSSAIDGEMPVAWRSVLQWTTR
jgi:hypothetical protein